MLLFYVNVVVAKEISMLLRLGIFYYFFSSRNFSEFYSIVTLVVPNVKKIRGFNLCGTPWAASACCRMTFTFIVLSFTHALSAMKNIHNYLITDN
jgi:hypothetical protein